MDLKHETAEQAIRGTPAVIGAVYSAVTLNEVVAVATLIYVIFQTVILLHKYYWAIQDRKNGKISKE